MGNCQAIDNASLVIQQPSGRVDKIMYCDVLASDIMKTNPGYYVALLLTTTLYPPSSATTNAVAATNNQPLRITRIKLLRPTDNLVLGHTYRLVTSQEVMKELWAKKYAKMQKKQSEPSGQEENHTVATKSTLEKKTKQMINITSSKDSILKHDRHRTKTSSSTNSAPARPKGWHPSLHSIYEASS